MGFILGDFWRALGDFFSQKRLVTLPTTTATFSPK
jgi:hypothetical protein